jgi:NADPH:quinone reductase-like Zn-dependent oxidoreductase
MTRKTLGVVSIILAIVLLSLSVAVSHDSPCAPATPLPDGTARMKAIVHRCYGAPAVLELEDVEKPAVADDEVLVRVHAASVNPLDWHYMRGIPYIMRLDAGFGAPTSQRMGVDFAGTVEVVGRSVTRFQPGDEVFGGRTGAFAEYVTVRESRAIVPKPANLTFEQAAAVPVAAVTALQALRDHGQVRPGQKVLINGASGGVGTFAVQLAKAFGAEVTGVCSSRNAELVRSIGADHVVDYTKEDFTKGERRYDLILDNVGNHALLDLRRVVTPEGIVVIVGGEKGRWISPLDRSLKAAVLSPFVTQRFVKFFADLNQKDLRVLADLMQTGKVTPVIDRRYPLREVPAAIEYLEEGHARGKVVIVPDVAAHAGGAGLSFLKAHL